MLLKYKRMSYWSHVDMLNFEMFKLDMYMCIRMQLYTIVTFVYDASTRAKKRARVMK